MNNLKKILITFLSALVLTVVNTSSSFAKVEGDTIVLGAAISLTGKYSSNAVNSLNC